MKIGPYDPRNIHTIEYESFRVRSSKITNHGKGSVVAGDCSLG